jgi:hypothetical protein
MTPPISIDGTDITGATIDGTDVQEITVDGQTVFTAGPSLQDIVAPGNLIAWYPFTNQSDDETRTGGLLDNAGVTVGDNNDYSGTVIGALYDTSGGVTDLDSGANSAYYDFDGSNDTISTPQLDLSGITAITFAAWVRYDNNPNGGYVVNMGSVDDDVTLRVANDDIFFFEKVNGDFDRLQASNVYNSTNWEHIAGTMDETGNGEIYLNGNPVKNSGNVVPDFSQINTPNLYIGSRDNSGNFADVEIDDVRVYDKILSSSEVSQIVTNTQP